MKIITWKELLSLKGTRVWSYAGRTLDGFGQAYVLYPNDFSIVEEDFPILKPEYEDCLDFYSTMEKFADTKVGVVSDLETSGDVFSREDDDCKVVLYSKQDLMLWQDKLSELIKDCEV
tara:strand:+ start:1197 stop:1550 length:354 start_codon:yes stop_codon:yes gene_type:complete